MLAYQLPSEDAVSPEQLTELINEVCKLVTLIKAMEGLNPDFKRWILHVLADIRTKLDLYDIYGGAIFHKIYVENFGEFAIFHELIKEEADKNEEVKGAMQRVGDLWNKCGVLMQQAYVSSGTCLKYLKFARLLAATPTENGTEFLDHLTSTIPDEMKE